MKKLNCWEFKQCGREAGGAHVDEFGVCPATKEQRLDGVHGAAARQEEAAGSLPARSAGAKSRGRSPRSTGIVKYAIFIRR